MNLTLTAERHGFEQGIQQGIEKGVQQGIERGIQRSEAQLLISILKVKFKEELLEQYTQQIYNADANTLNQWAINFVHARSLDDVFKS